MMSQPTQSCELEAGDEKDSRIRELEARVVELEGALARAGVALPEAAPLAPSSPARANRGGRKARTEGVPTHELSPAALKRRKRQKQQEARRARPQAVGEADVAEAGAVEVGADAELCVGADAELCAGTTGAVERCAELEQALEEMALELIELESVVEEKDALIARLVSRGSASDLERARVEVRRALREAAGSAAKKENSCTTWYCNDCLDIVDRLEAQGKAVDVSSLKNSWDATLADDPWNPWCQKCHSSPFRQCITTHVRRANHGDGKLLRFRADGFERELVELLARKLFSAAGGVVCRVGTCGCGGQTGCASAERVAPTGGWRAAHTPAVGFQLCESAEPED
jgi:hypothetical protein